VTFDAARFFPDGKALLVSGSEAGRPVRCYVQDLESGKPRAVTPEGTLNGIVSPDGNWILAGLSGAGLAVYPVAGGEGRVIPGTSAGDTGIRWSRDNRTVLVYREGELPINVRRLNPETGKGELVRILGPNDLGGVSSIQGAYLTADEQSHSYTLWKFSSHLFLAEGAQ
jgi:Tol biopolymer transport system component